MSIDVNYYSFSPSRADQQWPHFIEDLSVLRKKHATWNQHRADSDAFDHKKEELEQQFEPRIAEIRSKIFDHFKKKGYMIPWVEWDKDEGFDRQGDPTTMTPAEKMVQLQFSTS